MKASLFVEGSPGNLVETTINHQADWAFVPLPLQDVTFSLDEEVWHALAQAKTDIARLDGAGRYLPNPDLLLSSFYAPEIMSAAFG